MISWCCEQLYDQLKHDSNKLRYEIDPWDLSVALEAGKHIVIAGNERSIGSVGNYLGRTAVRPP